MTGRAGDQAVRPSGDSPDRPTAGPPDPPPIGKTWRRLYAFVILFLALQVLLYYAFTKAFE